MIIIAKFTGEESLGYKRNVVYVLKVENGKAITIQRQDGSGKCKYDSFISFLRNWDEIKSVKRV